MSDSQLSFNLINANEPCVDEIAAMENIALIKSLEDVESWPNQKLMLSGQRMSGIHKIIKDWQGENKLVFEIDSLNEIDEAKLLSLLVLAESKKIHLLVCCFDEFKNFQILSPDLKSRLDGLMRVRTYDANLKILTNIFKKWAREYGILIKPNHIEMLISSLKLDFVIISQLIEYIKSNYQNGAKFLKPEIKNIINGFENQFLGTDLLDDC